MKRIVIAGLALVVAVIAAIFIYFNFIRDDAPEEFGLTEATESGDDSETADGGDDTDDAGETADAGEDEQADAAPESLDGTWSVVAGSEAGYRVVEDLGSIQDFEAVGRTDDITGSIDISGTTVTSGAFEVDIASITSDDDRRDGQFRGEVMNSTEFPVATLTITEPIELDAIPATGAAVSTTATGELTLRGVTNAVTFPVDAQLLGGQIEIVGSIDVLFSDYGIANPSNPFVSVRDEGKVEVKLLLEQ